MKAARMVQRVVEEVKIHTQLKHPSVLEVIILDNLFIPSPISGVTFYLVLSSLNI